jgi:polar amino acid transport system permease protein
VTYEWKFAELGRFLDLWLSGVGMTLALSALVVVTGTIMALSLVGGLRSRFVVLNVLARIYIDLFRAVPALVLIGTLYFCLPIVVGVRLSAFQTAYLALAMNLAPFAAECIRAAVNAIPTIHYDSARVLGLTARQRARYVTGPQIVRNALPSLMGQYITTLKLTSLAATIGVAELWNVTGQITTQTSLPLEAKLGGAALYVAVILPFIWVSLSIERRLNIIGLGPISER